MRRKRDGSIKTFLRLYSRFDEPCRVDEERRTACCAVQYSNVIAGIDWNVILALWTENISGHPSWNRFISE